MWFLTGHVQLLRVKGEGRRGGMNWYPDKFQTHYIKKTDDYK